MCVYLLKYEFGEVWKVMGTLEKCRIGGTTKN
jgi:hypothetical protein